MRQGVLDVSWAALCSMFGLLGNLGSSWVKEEAMGEKPHGNKDNAGRKNVLGVAP